MTVCFLMELFLCRCVPDEIPEEADVDNCKFIHLSGPAPLVHCTHYRETEKENSFCQTPESETNPYSVMEIFMKVSLA